jgi:hypothetical protein
MLTFCPPCRAEAEQGAILSMEACLVNIDDVYILKKCKQCGYVIEVGGQRCTFLMNKIIHNFATQAYETVE